MYRRGKNWVSDFWHDGHRYTKSWGAISKTVAGEKDRKFRTEVLEGKYALKAKRIMFEKFCKKYLEDARVNKKPKSATRNEVSINILMPSFEGKLIDSIRPYSVEQYKKARRDAGRAPATVNRDVATLKNMMNKAVEWGFLSYNPILKVRQLKEDNEKMWVLSRKEEIKLLEACDAVIQKREYLKDLVVVALHSGMRLSEILNLKKNCIDLKERYLLVTDTKNHDNRKVPVNETLKAVLEKRTSDPENIIESVSPAGNIEPATESQTRPLARSEYLFHDIEGDRITFLTKTFWKVIRDAGLIRTELKNGESRKVRFRFHDLRHTFGSRLGMAGVDLKTIMEIMGHKTHRIAMRYQHPVPDHKLNAVKILDQVPSKVTTPEIDVAESS